MIAGPFRISYRWKRGDSIGIVSLIWFECGNQSVESLWPCGPRIEYNNWKIVARALWMSRGMRMAMECNCLIATIIGNCCYGRFLFNFIQTYHDYIFAISITKFVIVYLTNLYYNVKISIQFWLTVERFVLFFNEGDSLLAIVKIERNTGRKKLIHWC